MASVTIEILSLRIPGLHGKAMFSLLLICLLGWPALTGVPWGLAL
jgi:hypothetical protein